MKNKTTRNLEWAKRNLNAISDRKVRKLLQKPLSNKSMLGFLGGNKKLKALITEIEDKLDSYYTSLDY